MTAKRRLKSVANQMQNVNSDEQAYFSWSRLSEKLLDLTADNRREPTLSDVLKAISGAHTYGRMIAAPVPPPRVEGLYVD